MLATRKQLEERIVLLTLVGSNLYKTNIEDSDIDRRGICIASKEYYIGIMPEPFYLQEKNQSFDESEPCIYSYLTGQDTKILELTKILKLLLENNPNCLDLLYSNEYDILDPVMYPLIDSRNAFLCKRARWSYGQYAKDQIALCNTHRGWLLEYNKNPDFFNEQPKPEDFGLNENNLRKDYNMFLELLYVLLLDAKTFHLDREPSLEELFSKVDYKGLLIRNYVPEEVEQYIGFLVKADSNYMDYLKRTKQYLKELTKFKNYQSWKANRNSKRAKLEAKVGYDCKNLGHAVRLYTMACEIVESQKVLVDRKVAGDADYIKAIREGKVTYDEVLTYVTQLEDRLEKAFVNTSLPDKPNTNLISNLQIQIIENYCFKN